MGVRSARLFGSLAPAFLAAGRIAGVRLKPANCDVILIGGMRDAGAFQEVLSRACLPSGATSAFASRGSIWVCSAGGVRWRRVDRGPLVPSLATWLAAELLWLESPGCTARARGQSSGT